MAHKLARLVYLMLKFVADCIDGGMEAYESRYRQQQLKWLTKQAAALNLQLFHPPMSPAEFLETVCRKIGGQSKLLL